MEVKCTQCNRTMNEDETERRAEHDLPPYQVCGFCGSDQLVDTDIAWAIRELQELKKTLAEFAEQPHLANASTKSRNLYQQVCRMAADNAGQVAEFLEEM